VNTKRLTTLELDFAIEILQKGGTVAIPTETVYGLAADATNEAAVRKIFHAKGRPAANPLIVHVATAADIERFATIEHAWIRNVIDRFSPGPISFVLKSLPGLATSVTAGLDTVAIRIPDHPLLSELLKASQLALAAPSANRSGRPSPTTWQAVIQDLDGLIDAVICDEPCRVGIESTVIDATHDSPIILRPGAITLEDLQTVAPNSRFAVEHKDETARSPGTQFRHYKPIARVVIVDGVNQINPTEDEGFAIIGLSQDMTSSVTQRAKLKQACQTVDEYVRDIFQFFRRADEAGCSTIYCLSVEEIGLAVALMDRLRRASAE
jgi:L-threonylcarbamoyladenylate synthase